MPSTVKYGSTWVTVSVRNVVAVLTLSDARRNDRAFAGAVAETQREGAGRLFRDLHVDVDFVGGALHRHGGDLDIGEVAKPVDAVFRQREAARVEPRAFELAHFASDHFVARAGIADDVDGPHIHPAARIHLQRQVDRVMLLVDLRLRVHRGECVAVLAVLVDHRLGGGLQFGGREAVARLDLDQLLQLGFAIQQVARQVDA
jgi:hypothetical protein